MIREFINIVLAENAVTQFASSAHEEWRRSLPPNEQNVPDINRSDSQDILNLVNEPAVDNQEINSNTNNFENNNQTVQIEEEEEKMIENPNIKNIIENNKFLREIQSQRFDNIESDHNNIELSKNKDK